MGPYFQSASIWLGWVLEMSGRTSVPKWPLGYPPPPEVTIDALSQFDAIYMIIPAYTSIFVLCLKHSWNTGLPMYLIRWWRTWATVDLLHYLKKSRFLMENRIQTCFHDRTRCKIHRGCVLMDKYTQIVPWSKIIVQKYDISVSVETFIAHSHKTLRWISILVATFNFYMLWLQSNRSYFIPVLYVYINKRRKFSKGIFSNDYYFYLR